MNAVLYARVSTERQAEKELSIPAQLSAMREFAVRQGWAVTREYVESGASARSADRPVLKSMLADIQESSGQVGAVVVHKIDRLARSVYDHATIRAMLKQSGVRLSSVVGNVDESISGQLVENIMASIAQFYSANLGEETKKGMRQLVLRGGWPHRSPRGYVTVRDADGNGSRCVPHPREGPLMKEAFELFATGLYSVKSVAGMLFEKGLVSRPGKPLSGAYLERLLENPFYFGRIRWQGLDVAGAHQPLISKELFDRVRVAFRKRRAPMKLRRPDGDLPLRGVGVCATCRGHMTSERHGKLLYYRCSRQAYDRSVCDAKYCNAEKAHRDLKRILLQLQISRDTADKIKAEATRILDARADERRSGKGEPRLEEERLARREMKATSAFAAGELSSEAFRSASREMRRERTEAHLAKCEVEPDAVVEWLADFLKTATTVWDAFERLRGERKVALIQSVLSVVVLSDEGVAGFVAREPFARVASQGNEGIELASAELVRLALTAGGAPPPTRTRRTNRAQVARLSELSTSSGRMASG